MPKKSGNYLSAVNYCKEKGYRKGTILVSSSWNRPRSIIEIDFVGVWMHHMNGEKKNGQIYVKRFPLDVTTINGD